MSRFLRRIMLFQAWSCIYFSEIIQFSPRYNEHHNLIILNYRFQINSFEIIFDTPSSKNDNNTNWKK